MIQALLLWLEQYLGDVYAFWRAVDMRTFFAFFWPFLIFEFPRYVALDVIGVGLFRLRCHRNRKERDLARERLFKENPLVSILAPGKNEGKHMYKLVKSLQEQTYRNLEIIVVDDGSDDKTSLICRDLERAGLIDRFISNKVRGGKASAANVAYRFSKGDLIVHVDCDCSFDRDAVEKILIPFYLDDHCGAVGGNVKVRNYNQNLATGVQALEYLKNISVGRTVTSYFGIYRVVSGAFGAFRRDILDNIGGWDIGPGLDGDITVKIRKLGYRIYFEPDAICLTAVPDAFHKLAKQRLRWSRSLVRFRLRKHRDVFLPSANFRFLDLISFVENITYNLLLDIKWVFYFVNIMVVAPAAIKLVIPVNILLYTGSNLVELLVAVVFSERKKIEIKYILYVPLMFLYIGFFLRAVRTIAYVSEFFFKSSYNDPWNPLKTSRKAMERGL